MIYPKEIDDLFNKILVFKSGYIQMLNYCDSKCFETMKTLHYSGKTYFLRRMYRIILISSRDVYADI